MTTNSVKLIEIGNDAILWLNDVGVRMTRDTDGAGWVSWDHLPRTDVLAWVRQIRLAGMAADEAQCNDDARRAFLYVGGEA
jgi:hypothetical protein